MKENMFVEHTENLMMDILYFVSFMLLPKGSWF